MNRGAWFLVVGCFCLAFFIQFLRLEAVRIIDVPVWAHQAEYVLTHNPNEFDFAAGYGHPGGPIIEGTILAQTVSGQSYEMALSIFLSVANGVLITAICVLAFLLRKNWWWSAAAFVMLSLNPSFTETSPPSLFVSYLLALLCLLTVYLFERRADASQWWYIAWGLVAGSAVATRIDIGSVFTIALFLVLISTRTYRQCVTLVLTAALAFIVLDPFMWFMPFQHVHDLVYKTLYHYAEIEKGAPIALSHVIQISVFAFLSMLFALITLCLGKRIPEAFPRRFLSILLLTSFLLYGVFMTSAYQAERYYVPVLFVWETLLPFFVFNLTRETQFGFGKYERTAHLFLNAIVLIGFSLYPVFSAIQYYFGPAITY